MNTPTNAADRWHPQLYTIKALVRLVGDVVNRHEDNEYKKCRMDEEISAAFVALRIAEERLQQVIDELTDVGGSYRLMEKEPAAT